MGGCGKSAATYFLQENFPPAKNRKGSVNEQNHHVIFNCGTQNLKTMISKKKKRKKLCTTKFISQNLFASYRNVQNLFTVNDERTSIYLQPLS